MRAYFGAAEALKQCLLSGVFPAKIRERFVDVLEYFGQNPFIVRSSSFLEDGFGNAFAGKYESVFCVNQGSPEQRLESFGPGRMKRKSAKSQVVIVGQDGKRKTRKSNSGNNFLAFCTIFIRFKIKQEPVVKPIFITGSYFFASNIPEILRDTTHDFSV